MNENRRLIKKILRESLVKEITKGGSYTLYHGSTTEIKNFIDDFVGGEKAVDQTGIYFTTSKDDAQQYGNFLYTVEVNPSTLFDETPTNEKKLAPIITKLVKMGDDWESSAQNYNENPNIGLIEFVKSSLRYNDTEKDVLQQVWIDFYRYDSVDFVRNCTSLGIDGIIVNRENNVKHVIIYNPSVIKIK